jgi:hypothetical protein
MHSEKPYEKQMFHKIWLVTRIAGDTSVRRKDQRDLANDNIVPPLLDRTAHKHQEEDGKKFRTVSTFKKEFETIKGQL